MLVRDLEHKPLNGHDASLLGACCHQGPWPCVCVFVFVFVCVCVCVSTCSLGAWKISLQAKSFFPVVMLHNLILHYRCILGNLCNEPKVYVVSTIYLRRISPNMAHLDVLTLIATVSECCGNGLTIYD